MSTEAPKKASTKPLVRLCFVSGDKGGVGKSMFSTALIDYLDANSHKVMVVDADTSNPDVVRMFTSDAEVVPCRKLNLQMEAGWMELMDMAVAHSDFNIVVSLPAGAGEFMQHYMKELHEFITAHDLVTAIELFWIMGKTADSVQLLDSAFKGYGEHFSTVRVILPMYWGKSEDFALWHNSPTKKQIEGKYGQTTILFPALHEECKTILWHPKTVMPYSAAEDKAVAQKLGMRPSLHYKLTTWIEKVAKCLNPIFKTA